MPLEIIGMVGTRDASEIKGPLIDGPVVDWTDGPVIDPDYLAASRKLTRRQASTGCSSATERSAQTGGPSPPQCSPRPAGSRF